jgi:hypothetical protein
MATTTTTATEHEGCGKVRSRKHYRGCKPARSSASSMQEPARRYSIYRHAQRSSSPLKEQKERKEERGWQLRSTTAGSRCQRGAAESWDEEMQELAMDGGGEGVVLRE